MENHHWGALTIVGLIIMIALFGGFKKYVVNTTPVSKTSSTQDSLNQAQKKLEDLKVKVAALNDSKYKGKVFLSNVNRSTNASQEYITIRVSSGAGTTVDVTGWRIASIASGASVAIPKGTALYFLDSKNQEDDIILAPGDIAYINTGLAPNNVSFKVNKCSGYLTQSQTYAPGINTSCPLARDEDLSKIPKYVSNDACFDYIDSYPTCKVQTTPLPAAWSPECKDFITHLSYSSCIATHKGDKDFYKPEWRVFLKRTQPLWKSERENIVLYDNDNKIVDSLTY